MEQLTRHNCGIPSRQHAEGLRTDNLNTSPSLGEHAVRQILARSLPGLLAILSTHAFAQPPATSDLFKKLDKNGDGRITAEELPNRQAMEKFDKNGDGVITREEVATTVKPGPGMAGPGKPLQGKGAGQYEAMIKAADKDGDGRITKAEAGDAAWFARIDRNQDGIIDAVELAKLKEAMRAGKGGGDGKPDDPLSKADTNADGRISRAEAGDPPWFDKVDKNQDCVLDAGEINVLRDAMAKQAGNK